MDQRPPTPCPTADPGPNPEPLTAGSLDRWREKARAWVESPRIQRLIIALICINAVTLGLETSPTVMDAAGDTLVFFDGVILACFVVELVAKLFGHGWRFFRSGWNIFDFVVVGVALVPASGPFAVLRALRILRVLRLISTIPRMRRVVEGLLSAIPGMGSIFLLMLLIFYVSAVVTTKLYGPAFPEWFGTIGDSLYSLFQIMTLESWSMGVVRPVMETYPYAWMFFVPFILVSSFMVLNLFIAVIVGAMQSEHQKEEAEAAGAQAADIATLITEIRALRSQVDGLKAALADRPGEPPKP